MSKLVTLIITLLIALVIGIGIYEFYQNNEYKEVTKRTGFHGEARYNPLYAARLFLKRMGIPSETKDSLQGIGELPDTNIILLLDTRRASLSPEKTDELLAWVESGGHLIAKASKDWKASDDDEEEEEDEDEDLESPDPLHRHLGVRTNRGNMFNELEEFSEAIDGLVDEALEEIIPDVDIPTITLEGAKKPLALSDKWFRPIRIIDDKHIDLTEQISLSGGDNYIIRQKHGSGLITLIADMKFIENKNLEKADHAEILWYLVHGLHTATNQPAGVWLIHNDEMPALWEILWKYAWAFILSLLFLLIAWFLSSTKRFGPVIPKEEENRRSLKEHITSSGNYYWKNNDKEKLLESARTALTQKLSRIYPGWSQHSQQEQIKVVSEQSEMTPENIQKLLFAPNIENPDDFTKAIQDLEKIRKSV